MRKSTRMIFLLAPLVAAFVGLGQGIGPTHGVVGAATQDSDFSYYSGGERIPLSLSTKGVAVRFTEDSTAEEQKAVLQGRESIDAYEEAKEIAFGLSLIPLKTGASQEVCFQVITDLAVEPKVEFAGLVFDVEEGELILTDEFNVKFASWASEADIETFNNLHNVEIARKREWADRYVLRVRDANALDALRTANLYYENAITKYSHPNFVIRSDQLLASNDTYFEEQWPLDNDGTFPAGASADADIDAPEGWEISTGSSDIVIAIIDTGVDLTHEDLVDKLVSGYDCYDDDADPSPGNSGADAGHGTSCAGLAAADTNNETGVAGVAWACKIMPIRVITGSQETSYDVLAAGIEWGAEHGADVLSNSWNYSFVQEIQDAIESAKDYGRDGKGCVIVFATGNQGSSVRFPATCDEVIAVGATDHEDERWAYSNGGPELDVVAPSGSGEIEGVPEVIMWTTDISGPGGYNPGGDEEEGDIAGDYDKLMGGTSGATPEVAGLAGLILSVNPDLTSNEVQYIIESTADDKGDVGRDDDYGWGRINVESALLAAVDLPPEDPLEHWWKFDEDQGTTAPDEVEGGKNGKVTNAQWVSGWIDGGLYFDGDGDYVSFGDSGDEKLVVLEGRTVTISAWIKRGDSESTYLPILTQYKYDNGNYGYYLGLKKKVDGKYYPTFYLDEDGAQSSDEVTKEKWYHIAGTYDGEMLKIYVNGVLQDSTYYNENSGADTAAYAGYDGYVGFNGIIDDVRVYNWGVNVDEILDKMYYGTKKFAVLNEAGIRVAWFDDLGNLFLKGELETNSDFDPPTGHDEFKFKDSSNNLVMVIDTSNGNMYIDGSYTPGVWPGPGPSGGVDEFIIEDSAGPVAYINESGNLYLKGELYQNPEP